MTITGRQTDSAFGKLAYGILFVVFLPLAVWIWARTSESQVPLAPIHSNVAGLTVVLAGVLVFLAGIVAIMVYGKGLPMNAYPPQKFVSKGIYRYLSHPIYVGFCAAAIGVALYFGSASGLYLIAPSLMLGCTALVFGYEREDLRRRFGEQLPRPRLSLPTDDDGPPTAWQRLSVYLLVLMPWLVLYELFVYMGPAHDHFSAYRSFELSWPVIEWTEVLYASVYVATILVPLVAATRRQLREFAVSGLLATAAMVLLFFAIPAIASPRPFDPSTPLGRFLYWERGMDSAAAAFPSMHVVWAFIAATLLGRRWPGLRLLWLAWATAVAISCVTTGMHALADVLAGFVLFLAVHHRNTIWHSLLKASERVSNSWNEWRFGSLRVINHGFYAGAGTLIGLYIVGLLSPSADIVDILLVSIVALIMGDFLAQAIEGSSKLLRPFGYYGAIVGSAIGIALSSWLLGVPFWEFIGAFAVAAPIIQAIGRLRCLIQGCCHGRLASPAHIGIRYNQPTSRVTRIAGLAGKPLYPTPLFSICFNLILVIILMRMWLLAAPLSLIVGCYFLASGLERFVEESYRGEPQTPLFGNLHIYQWLAIVSIVIGAAITTLESPHAYGWIPFRFEPLIPALIGGLLATIAMGVDFPGSNKRFARLTS